MDKRVFLCMLLLLMAILLAACAPAQKAPEPPAEQETVSALPDTEQEALLPAQPPAPRIAEGEPVLFLGHSAATCQNEDVQYLCAEDLAQAAGVHVIFDEESITLTLDGVSESFPVARTDALDAGEGFLQDGAAYVPLLELAGRFSLARGEAPDGRAYFAKETGLSEPPENVNVPVLMYHAVSDDVWGYRDLFVSPQTMEEELLYLQENGYETIWFSDLSHLEDYEKPVILTFDDGYDDNYTELFPLLQKYNAKATIFVIPKYIGAEHKMTAEQVQELAQSGLVSIQSHTYSHGNLSTMDEETLIYEMQESQNYLAALTGQVPYVVCYPEGTRSELSIEVAGRYYDYGLLMNGQLYNTSDDPMRVKRFYIPRGYDLGSFKWSIEQAGTIRK